MAGSPANNVAGFVADIDSGIVRGDLYRGFGDAALARAGRMKSAGSYYLLQPKAPAPTG